MIFTRAGWGIAFTLVLTLTTALFAQPKSDGTGEPTGPLTIQENVAQAFRVEPVVQRFTARRGEIIPFEFVLTSLGKQTQVEVIPVNMRQELSGIILPDTAAAANKLLKILSKTDFTLENGSSETLKGELTVPNTKSNFLSYGLLVREKTVQADFKPADVAAKTQAGVKFITQYLLRLDVETEQSEEQQFRELQLESLNLAPVEGMPTLQAHLVNPTNSAFECRVAAYLKTGSGPGKKPVFLTMGTRAKLEGEERLQVKIMPHSRLLLSAMPESSLTPGDGTLSVCVMSGRREITRAEKALHISMDDFPSLQAKFNDLTQGLIASPAAILLGQNKGDKHSIPLTFANFGTEPRNITLQAESLSGEPFDSMSLSHTKLEIIPGKTQTVRVSMKSRKGANAPVFGWVRISSGDETLPAIPVSLLYGPLGTPDLEITPVTLHTTGSTASFRLEVKNNSAGFTPLHGKLDFLDSSGRGYSLQAGYGKVLLPGKSMVLNFATENLAQGELATSLSLFTYPGVNPLQRTQAFTIADQTAKK